jgi:hypothetical protein
MFKLVFFFLNAHYLFIISSFEVTDNIMSFWRTLFFKIKGVETLGGRGCDV